MPMSQEVERIFKLRQQFKQCRTDQEVQERQSSLDMLNKRSETGGASEIMDLIKKFKS